MAVRRQAAARHTARPALATAGVAALRGSVALPYTAAMRPSPSSPSNWKPILLAWAILAMVFLPQAIVLNLSRPDPWPLWLTVLRNVTIFLLWALFTPVAIWAVRRWPPFGAARLRNGLRLLLLALALTAVHLLAMAAVTAATAGGPVDPVRLLLSMAVGLAATNLLMAAALFAVGIAQLHFEARRQAERQLADARLAALRHQLQPHFLFNTLNALAELVHTDAARAESLLLRLSALLRRALDDSLLPRITLREELDFLDDYLAIQQALFGERLAIEREVAPDALDARLPPMLLQPLAENALRHGLGPRRAGGTLRIGARRTGETLRLEIADDGLGARAPLREGVGLRNTRERLASDYGAQAELSVATTPGEGFRAVIALPWSTA